MSDVVDARAARIRAEHRERQSNERLVSTFGYLWELYPPQMPIEYMVRMIVEKRDELEQEGEFKSERFKDNKNRQYIRAMLVIMEGVD